MKLHIFIILILFFWGTICVAGETILTIQGLNVSNEIQMNENEIRSLPAMNFSTFDPWDNKKRRYRGCLLKDLLKKYELYERATLFEIIAKNDYKAIITKKELDKYDYTLSYEMDGKDYSEFGEENKGPLAIAVEMEKVEDAYKSKIKNQFVWWIEKIIIK